VEVEEISDRKLKVWIGEAQWVHKLRDDDNKQVCKAAQNFNGRHKTEAKPAVRDAMPKFKLQVLRAMLLMVDLVDIIWINYELSKCWK